MNALELHNLAQTYRRLAVDTESYINFDLFCSMARRLDKFAEATSLIERRSQAANDTGIKAIGVANLSGMSGHHFTSASNLFQDRLDLQSHE
jgi:hypothetical protein